MASLPHHMLSVEEYLQVEEDNPEIRYEYIDGQVYMLAGGTVDLSTIAINVTSLLRPLLRGKGCHVYNSDLRVKLSEKRYVYPDATISCDPQNIGTSKAIQSPRVVIEVLSPSTEAYDRGRKFTYYRACSTIQEYLLIDTQQPLIELYRREKKTLWTLHVFELTDTVELNSVGIRFPVAAVYEDVVFSPQPPDNDDLLA